MDFISSISFPNEPPISLTFLGHFCRHYRLGATAKQQQTHPKMVKRFIRERNTIYKIGTLVAKVELKYKCET